MHRMNQEEGRYRVLLIGVGDNTEAGRELFCNNISKNYGISLPLLKEIVDRCPIVLKKNLSLEKAVALAKTLKSFGGVASVEEKRDSPAVLLEFQEIEPYRLALESSSLRRTKSGAWNVIGRVKNISEESLNDTWVLIQIFDDLELLTFDEVSIPINPLHPGGASPFKVVFEGNLPIKRISIAFKNSSGHPLPATDRRIRREWVEVEIDDGNLSFPSSSFFTPLESPSIHGGDDINETSRRVESTTIPHRKGEVKAPSFLTGFTSEHEREPQPLDIAKPSEEVSMENYSDIQRECYRSLTPETPPFTIEESSLEESSQETILEPVGRSEDSTLRMEQEEGGREEEGCETLREDQPPQTLTLSPLSHTDQPQDISDETPLDASGSEEAASLMEEIPTENGKGEEELPIPWIEEFRSSIETYYQKPRGIFFTWFEAHRKGDEFIHSLHSLLTILLHARFDQMSHSEKALENTQRVFKLSLQPDLQLEQIPPLEGTEFFSAENWRVLFHRAIPKLQQVANHILEKGQWDALDLERVIQVIPHMSDKNSRMAVRWIHELIQDIVTIDFSNTPISIEESLYRVASRLGVVDPNCDFYEGENSIGDLKIQSFAKAVFPKDPLKIEEPMIWVGRKEEGGHCFPTQPRCNGCLFEAFCPRLQSHFNPSEKGMKNDK